MRLGARILADGRALFGFSRAHEKWADHHGGQRHDAGGKQDLRCLTHSAKGTRSAATRATENLADSGHNKDSNVAVWSPQRQTSCSVVDSIIALSVIPPSVARGTDSTQAKVWVRPVTTYAVGCCCCCCCWQPAACCLLPRRNPSHFGLLIIDPPVMSLSGEQ